MELIPVQEFKDRLRQMMEFKQISAADLSKNTNIAQSTIYAYLQGRIVPRADKITIIAKYLDVNALWLRGYNAPMQEGLEQKITAETIYIIANTMREDFILHTATTDKDLAAIVYTQLKDGFRGTSYEDDLQILEFSHEQTLGLLNGYFKYTTDDCRRSNLSKPYPRKLLQELTDISPETASILTDPITDDMERGIEYAISTLLVSEQEVIRLLYKERKPVREISEQWGCSYQNVSAMKQRALLKLLSPPCFGYIQHGKNGFANLVAEQKKQTAPTECESSISLSDLNLSTHSLNALTKKGYKTVTDITLLTKKEISLIRNLGNRSIIEVAEALERIDVCNTAWLEFLHKKS